MPCQSEFDAYINTYGRFTVIALIYSYVRRCWQTKTTNIRKHKKIMKFIKKYGKVICAAKCIVFNLVCRENL